MFLLTALTLLLTLNYSHSTSITCNYDDRTANLYTCVMTIENPDGFDEFSSISGRHINSRVNDDVTRVQISNGNSQNFPRIICEKFKNLKVLQLNIFNLKMENFSISECENLRELFLVLSQDVEINLKNSKIEILVFESSSDRNSINFNPKWFQNLESLESLTVVDEISKIPQNSFKSAKNLNFIQFLNSRIDELNFDSFGNLENLKTLRIQSDNLKNLDFNIFDQPKDLNVVDIPNSICAMRINVRNFSEEKVENLRDLERCFEGFSRKEICEFKFIALFFFLKF